MTQSDRIGMLCNTPALLLDSGFRRNDNKGGRLHGYTPAWMYAYRDAGGRPRLEQAVEVVDRVGNKRSR